MKVSVQKASNKQVIAKKPLTNLYEMNSMSCSLWFAIFSYFYLTFWHSKSLLFSIFFGPCHNEQFVFAPYFLNPSQDFIELWSNVLLSKATCKTYEPTILGQGRGHTSRSSVWNFVSIPKSFEGFSSNFGQKFTSKAMCKTHELANWVKVTLQSHNF